MPEIELMPWDSQMLGLRVGKVHTATPPSADAMDTYDMLLARLPTDDEGELAQWQNDGFKFVALDLELAAQTLQFRQHRDDQGYRCSWLSRQPPEFVIEGFCIDDSRLMRDPKCRSRLPSSFWDRVVYEHCAQYADMVACAIDSDNHLLGFVSCFVREKVLQLFMVAVHPLHQGKGIGGALLAMVNEKAQENSWSLTTQVLASNLGAMNFYLGHGFKPVGSELVLHRWRREVPE